MVSLVQAILILSAFVNVLLALLDGTQLWHTMCSIIRQTYSAEHQISFGYRVSVPHLRDFVSIMPEAAMKAYVVKVYC